MKKIHLQRLKMQIGVARERAKDRWVYLGHVPERSNWDYRNMVGIHEKSATLAQDEGWRFDVPNMNCKDEDGSTFWKGKRPNHYEYHRVQIYLHAR